MQEQFESINPFRIDVRETHAGFDYFHNDFDYLLKGQNRARVHLSTWAYVCVVSLTSEGYGGKKCEPGANRIRRCTP